MRSRLQTQAEVPVLQVKLKMLQRAARQCLHHNISLGMPLKNDAVLFHAPLLLLQRKGTDPFVLPVQEIFRTYQKKYPCRLLPDCLFQYRILIRRDIHRDYFQRAYILCPLLYLHEQVPDSHSFWQPAAHRQDLQYYVRPQDPDIQNPDPQTLWKLPEPFHAERPWSSL